MKTPAPIIKKGPAVFLRAELKLGSTVHQKAERWDVRVMAVAEGYAMVRRKGCMPFVATFRELEQAA